MVVGKIYNNLFMSGKIWQAISENMIELQTPLDQSQTARFKTKIKNSFHNDLGSSNYYLDTELHLCIL